MDPYLERHLRLADRRGLFMGVHLSRVQAFGLELILVSEERAKVRDFVDRFKLALVSHDPGVWVEQMFPEWSTDPNSLPEGEVERINDVTDLDLMDTAGEWHFEERVSPEEAERILAEMVQRPKGSFGIDDVEDDGKGWV